MLGQFAFFPAMVIFALAIASAKTVARKLGIRPKSTQAVVFFMVYVFLAMAIALGVTFILA